MYTKIQQDMAWALFALAIKQGKQIADMQSKWDEMAKQSALKDKWDEMAKQSALKDKIIAELKKERKMLDNGVHVREVSI